MRAGRLALSLFTAVVSVVAVAGCSDEPAARKSRPSDAAPSPGQEPGTATGPTAALTGRVVAERVGVPRQLVPLDDRRTLLVDQYGLVHVLEGDGLSRTPFLDLRDQVLAPAADRPETGLAGLVLAPDFQRSGLVYTRHTRQPTRGDGGGVERVEVLTEWKVGSGGERVDPASARELLSVPFEFADHVGGLAIDEQGLLYVGFGSIAQDGSAQDTGSWAGKIIRIDPRRGDPYTVPEDNPFADGDGGRPEVWSLGHRNPFRMVWQQGLGLVVAQPMWQEKDQQVSVVEGGDNAGYPVVIEGTETSCWVDGEVAAHCREFTAPHLEYGPDVGQIVSGAQPYRGPVAALADRVVVSDWSGELLAAEPGPAPWQHEPIEVEWPAETSSMYLWGLGTDGRDELYALMADPAFGRGGVVVALSN